MKKVITAVLSLVVAVFFVTAGNAGAGKKEVKSNPCVKNCQDAKKDCMKESKKLKKAERKNAKKDCEKKFKDCNAECKKAKEEKPAEEAK